MDWSDADPPAITFAYRPAGLTAKGQPATAAGGARVTVSSVALVAIRSLILDDDGRLPMTARVALERIDKREDRATELRVLVRALARRDVFVR